MMQELKNAFGKVYITITVDKGNNWVHTDWQGYLTSENVKAGALAYTNIVKEAGLNCVLNDTSKVLGTWSHSLDWVINEWGPQAARAGVKHFALVTNPESLAESSASSFYSNLKAFEVKVFDSLTLAEGWLRQHSMGNKKYFVAGKYA